MPDSSLPPRENVGLPLEQVAAKFCPRKLKKGQVKRYMSKGPLYGYMIACPGCGFIELHATRDASFVEEDERVVSSMGAISCQSCKAALTIGVGQIVASYTVG